MNEMLFEFCLGLVILLFSTQKFVSLAEKISSIFRISPLIVGVTIVAIGTSLPELVVSVISVLKNDAGLAMGNIVGSNIVNVLMVFPVGLFIGKLRIGTSKTQRNALILLVVTIIFFTIQLVKPFQIISGLFLVGFAVFISIVEYRLGISGRTHEDSKQFSTQNSENISLSITFFGLFLILGIIGGGLLLVNSVEKLSHLTGISTTILGLTLTAIATSLPELFTTIFSQKDDQEKITIGNVLGSNIYNLLLIGGIISLFSPATIIQTKEWIWLMISTIGFVSILRHYKGQKPPKVIGVILLFFLLVYILSQ